jgi:Phage integrase family
VVRYRAFLEGLTLSAAKVNLHLSAIRRLADEAAESGWLSPELAIGIRRVKGVKRLGRRIGNWLTGHQAQDLVNAISQRTLRGRRDAAMIGLLLGCGLRRSETVNLRLDQLQSRQNHWVIVDMIGKGGRLRTVPVAIVSSIVVPIPALSKTAWMRAFWPEPISVFGSSMLTMPVAVHICWTYHSARPSHRLDAGSVRKPLTGLPLSRPTEGPCLGSSRAAVISYADAE